MIPVIQEKKKTSNHFIRTSAILIQVLTDFFYVTQNLDRTIKTLWIVVKTFKGHALQIVQCSPIYFYVLPYRDKNNTLIFPTGEFVGVYYSEELKYARGLGYTVLPISGYLFEKMKSPFRDFVSSLFESRLEARKSGNKRRYLSEGN